MQTSFSPVTQLYPCHATHFISKELLICLLKSEQRNETKQGAHRGSSDIRSDEGLTFET